MLKTVAVIACALLWVACAFSQNNVPTQKLDHARLGFRTLHLLGDRVEKMVSSEAIANVDAVGMPPAAVTIHSVPHWSSSFVGTDKKTYTFSMVGAAPGGGASTTVPIVLLPIKVAFSGTTFTYNPTSRLTPLVNSPLFATHAYNSGTTQYVDAFQRAAFNASMKPTWHTLLGAPKVLPLVTITMPKGSFTRFTTSTGKVVFGADINKFAPLMINKVLAASTSSQFVMAVTDQMVLYDTVPGNCCIGGFHTAVTRSSTATSATLQTLEWSSWFFANEFGAGASDIYAIAHEVAEWADDPFPSSTTNIVQKWEFPDNSACQNNLEVGDPIEVLANSSSAITTNGVTYHPTNLALFQWFARISASNALGHAYSWPKASLLPSAAKNCLP